MNEVPKRVKKKKKRAHDLGGQNLNYPVRNC